MTAQRLGAGGDGPWENRSAAVAAEHPNPAAIGGWLNAEHSVQRFVYVEHPGVDLLTVRRHDDEPVHPGWAAMQKIKNRLLEDGDQRFAIEQYPPAELVIDNYNLYHLWVMPLGWPGIGLHPSQAGGGIRL